MAQSMSHRDLSPRVGDAPELASRLRFADLSSSVGAGVLGVGLGVMLAAPLRGLTIPLLGLGLVLHAWGMTDKHRLESRQGALRPWWSSVLYWVCWVALVALVAIVGYRLVR